MTATAISREYIEVFSLDPPMQKITTLRAYNYEATKMVLVLITLVV